ncbi:serine hydrolase domain-containing protein [Mucilaginibacter myungsuensis]|uniref:Beta-lactamase family protein n=1 Tax=Mucilaginibacter myungsuensis TaxID=649104 RepID=A0A929KV66_9SPHI|nr:serine hydrolase domain-containing protein [Mucilaginibacter myungsuensis]MBE9661045.1 beta-lactamase family protein [Mucilaginibacter myungsuensis]MDN3597189.1 serine hydrolase domain-containing protein [Mucilaginibacter myungsuensis]
MIFVYKNTFAVLLSLFLLSSCSSDPAKQSDAEVVNSKPLDIATILKYDPKKADPQIDAFMQHLHKVANFNGNVLVAKKGKIVYQNALGWANYPRQDSLTLASQFELASVTKTMTGIAIMQLWERGKIKLDQNVKEFFPDFPYEGVTIRLLLTHRSGMMNYVYFVDGIYRKEKRDQKKGLNNQDAMKLIAEYKPARYIAPDKKFHYNNSNYMVLTAILEKVTGQRYSQYMMENVFKPAGMKNTNVYSKAEYEKIPTKVMGHDRNSWKYSVAQNFLDGPVGDKGIYSTVGDLLIFDRALRAGKLIKPATQDSAYKPRNPLVRGHFSYGYGWRTFEAPNQQVVYHTGWWHGFRHIYLRDLKNDVVIVLLGNMVNGSLLHLDDLYKAAGMPVVRKEAYTGAGDTSED